MPFTPSDASTAPLSQARVIPFARPMNEPLPVTTPDQFGIADLSPWQRLRFAMDCLRSPDQGVSQRAYVWAFQETVFHQDSLDALCLALDINSVSFRRALLERFPNARRHHAQRRLPPVSRTG